MTDPERMTADDLEALAEAGMARYPRGPEVAALILSSPVLALRLARLLRAVEKVLDEATDEGWCNFCDSETFHYAECPIPVLRAAMEVGE